MTKPWSPTAEYPPPDGRVVMAKTDDHRGRLKELPLIRKGRLWWHADGSPYGDCEPTHWRELEEGENG